MTGWLVMCYVVYVHTTDVRQAYYNTHNLISLALLAPGNYRKFLELSNLFLGRTDPLV